MTLTLDTGKTLDILWMWGPLPESGHVMMQYEDDRPLRQIAEELEGRAHMVRRSETQGDMAFDGYTRLEALIRQSGGRVQATFSRPGGQADETEEGGA